MEEFEKGENMDISRKYKEILKRDERMSIKEIIDENINTKTAILQAEFELGLEIDKKKLVEMSELLKIYNDLAEQSVKFSYE